MGVIDDLISRSALLAAYDKAHQGPPGGARKLIEEAPEALVRCKDCTYRGEINCPQYYRRTELSDDYFCADGKRLDGMTDIEKAIEGFKKAGEEAKTIIEKWVSIFEQNINPVGIDDAIAMLKEQEAVKPTIDEDSHGHWVVLENCSNAGVYCSECHAKIFGHYPMKKKYSYYCPHCGTRMEGQVVKWE